MKRITVTLIVMVLIATLFTACGTKEENKQIVVATFAGDPFESSWKEIGMQFEEETGYKVIVDAIPWENLRDKSVLELTNDASAYDVLYVHPSWFAEFVANNYLLDASEYATSKDTDLFVKSLLNGYTVDGILYGFPDFITTQVIAYRKDIFAEKNIPIPTTWDEILEACMLLSDNEDYKPITFPGRKGGTLSSVFNALLVSNETWYFDESGNVTLDGEKTLEVIEFLQKLSMYQPDGYLNVHWDENGKIASSGKAAMAIIATPNSAWLEDKETSMTYADWGYTPIISNQGVAGGIIDDYCWSVTTGSENKEMAGEFVKKISGTEAQVYFTETSSTCGATIEYYENESLKASKPVLSAMQVTLETAVHAPTWSNWAKEQETIEASLQSVMVGEITPAQAKDNIMNIYK